MNYLGFIGRRDWTRTNDPHHVKVFPLLRKPFIHADSTPTMTVFYACRNLERSQIMQLYKTTYQVESSDGATVSNVTKWGGSQTEATKHRVEGKGVAFKKPETQTVEVPTNKAGLLDWLNANAVS